MGEYKDFFDELFFRGEKGQVGIGVKGGVRTGTPNNLGILFGVAKAIIETFKDVPYIKKVYEAGAGVGWLSRFLSDGGMNLTSSDISQWASDHSKEVSGVKVYQSDVRGLMDKEMENSFDLVIAWNVLAYLPEEEMIKALHNLRYLTNDYIVLSIVVDEVIPKRPHGTIGRKGIKPREWWYPKFKEAGLVYDKERTERFCKLFDDVPEETGAFILRKSFASVIEDGSDNYIAEKDANFYKEVVGIKDCLEVGCGYGYTIKYLRELGVNARGVEVNRKIIKESPNAEFIKYGSATKLPFPDKSFDWVISKSVLEHIYNEEDVIKEFSRVAREGVYVLICLEKRGDPTHINIKTREEWIQAFARFGFDEISDSYMLPKMTDKQREEVFIFKKGGIK